MSIKTVEQSVGDIATLYPHSPANVASSVSDYLEAELSDGWELTHVLHSSGAPALWVFRSVEQDE